MTFYRLSSLRIIKQVASKHLGIITSRQAKCVLLRSLRTDPEKQRSKSSLTLFQFQRAPFHSSPKRFILPALPQRIDGTVNDAVPIHEPSPVHGSYHWTFERLVAVALVPLTIAPFAVESMNPVMDAILCGTVVVHSHIGFQSVIIDYVPLKRLPKTRAAFWWGLRVATLAVAAGLYEFETNDVGAVTAIRRIWNA